jgi:hypothetical protein
MPKTSSEGRRKTVSKASTLRLAPAGAGSSSNPDREDDDANEVHDEEVPPQEVGGKHPRRRPNDSRGETVDGETGMSLMLPSGERVP